MFYIAPFIIGERLPYMEVDDFLKMCINEGRGVDVVDSKDMISERTNYGIVSTLVKKRVARFPQLLYRHGKLELSDDMSIVGRFGDFTFTDKKFHQRVSVRRGRKAFKAYDKYFTKYIEDNNISLKESNDTVERSADTFYISSDMSRFKVEITFQGIIDDYDNPVVSALFINKQFVCYLDTEFTYGGEDEVSVTLAQFIRRGRSYFLTFVQSDNCKHFTIELTKGLRVETIHDLDFVKDIQI